jgi:hypothetical protein
MILSDHLIKARADGAGGAKGGVGVAVGAVTGFDPDQ